MKSVEQLPSANSLQGKQGDGESPATHPGSRRWGRDIALGLLAAYALTALVIAWSRWGKFDPAMGSQARERVGISLSPTEHPWYYPMLLLHIVGASVALATCVFQIWPWLRRTHPRVHRYVGRVYVFAGVVPGAIFALVVQAFWPFSVVTAFSQVVMALLWLSVTLYGFVLRRQGRIADHRRWMFRSFALTCTVLVELTINPIVELIINTQLHTRLASSLDIFMQVKDTNENWLGLTICLVAVEWKLERERIRGIEPVLR